VSQSSWRCDQQDVSSSALLPAVREQLISALASALVADYYRRAPHHEPASHAQILNLAGDDAVPVDEVYVSRPSMPRVIT
jgi:hypothetical protein